MQWAYQKNAKDDNMSEEPKCIKLSLKEELAVIHQRLLKLKSKIENIPQEKGSTLKSKVFIEIAEDMVRRTIIWMPEELE